jgi:hypothetical protein
MFAIKAVNIPQPLRRKQANGLDSRVPITVASISIA